MLWFKKTALRKLLRNISNRYKKWFERTVNKKVNKRRQSFIIKMMKINELREKVNYHYV